MSETAEKTMESIIAAYPEEVLYFRVNPKDIDVFNKIIEAYDNLAIVSTVEPKTAKLCLWVTENNKPVLLKLIKKMPIKVMLWEEYTALNESK